MQPPAQHSCPRCGAPIQVGQKHCARCGLALDSQSLAAFQATQTRPAPGPYTQAPIRARPRANTRLISSGSQVRVLSGAPGVARATN